MRSPPTRVATSRRCARSRSSGVAVGKRREQGEGEDAVDLGVGRDGRRGGHRGGSERRDDHRTASEPHAAASDDQNEGAAAERRSGRCSPASAIDSVRRVVAQQAYHRLVVAEHQRGEPLDAARARGLGDAGEQHAPEPGVLEVVDDQERDLGARRVLGRAGEARDRGADRALGARGGRADRVAVPPSSVVISSSSRSEKRRRTVKKRRRLDSGDTRSIAFAMSGFAAGVSGDSVTSRPSSRTIRSTCARRRNGWNRASIRFIDGLPERG